MGQGDWAINVSCCSRSVNVWWRRKQPIKQVEISSAPRSRPRNSCKLHIQMSLPWKRPSSTLQLCFQMPDTQRGCWIVCKRARHWASGPYTYFIVVVVVVVVVVLWCCVASMTYARAHDDLIWLRNAIRLQLLCKYFTAAKITTLSLKS